MKRCILIRMYILRPKPVNLISTQLSSCTLTNLLERPRLKVVVDVAQSLWKNSLPPLKLLLDPGCYNVGG